MTFNASDFTLNEIISVNKDFLLGKLFKLHVQNKDYVIYISKVAASFIEIHVYNMKHQSNDNEPIEYGIKRYHQKLKEWEDYFYFRLYLGDILQNYDFELSEISKKTADVLDFFYKYDNLIMLMSNSVYYKDLKEPSNKFERRFSKLISEICLRRINDDVALQKILLSKKQAKEREKEELRIYRKNLEKRNREMEEKYRDVNSYGSSKKYMDESVKKLLR